MDAQEMSTNIAQNIRDKMDEKRFTVASLEREAGLKVSAVRNILLGKSKHPSADTLKAIAIALNCTVDELLGESDIQIESPAPENYPNREKINIKDFKLFGEVASETIKLFEENKKNPTINDIFFTISEVYLYSIENNMEKVDKSFLNWIYSRNF